MLPESHDELSQTLRQLKVAAPALDRDRLLFEAGRRSVKRSWVWPMATAASVMVACLSGWMVYSANESRFDDCSYCIGSDFLRSEFPDTPACP